MTQHSNPDWSTFVRERVDAHLVAFFDKKRAQAERLSPRGLEMVNATAALTLRGGKRLRPLVLAAAYSAVNPEGDLADCIAAGASLELLQSYLLIHDDWMDRDEERRGGPAVHTMFREPGRDPHLADCLGVLTGDLAGTYAWELMAEAPFPRWRRDEGFEAFATLQIEVYFGQHLDVVADRDVERMHHLKTGSYTVRGPAQLGAVLADANPDQVLALTGWADPLGEAFQLRDDLLGTFAVEGTTGKPGDDLRHGKRTALILEAEQRLDAAGRETLAKVFGRAEASDGEVAATMEALVACGAKDALERRCAELRDVALAAIGNGALASVGCARLTELARRLTDRDR
ncbi:MAG: polyprenyl synthetase family protein [Sandaracinaceae bacterium]|nr:polyprenyl synthetase family protein [Sandaracinaceae bacterium]